MPFLLRPTFPLLYYISRSFRFCASSQLGISDSGGPSGRLGPRFPKVPDIEISGQKSNEVEDQSNSAGTQLGSGRAER
jgi:hypothetical protein